MKPISNGKKDRLKKRKARLEGEIEEIKGSKGKTSSSGSVTGGVDFNAGNGNCGIKGSCEKGNLRAMKSKPSKGRKEQKGSSGLLNVSGKKKYKKLRRKKSRLEKVSEKLKSQRSPQTRYTNPRFL